MASKSTCIVKDGKNCCPIGNSSWGRLISNFVARKETLKLIMRWYEICMRYITIEQLEVVLSSRCSQLRGVAIHQRARLARSDVTHGHTLRHHLPLLARTQTVAHAQHWHRDVRRAARWSHVRVWLPSSALESWNPTKIKKHSQWSKCIANLQILPFSKTNDPSSIDGPLCEGCTLDKYGA